MAGPFGPDPQQMLVIPANVVAELITYLSKRPWAEVHPVMPVLTDLLTVEEHLKAAASEKVPLE